MRTVKIGTTMVHPRYVELRFQADDLTDLCGFFNRILNGMPIDENAKAFARKFRNEIKRNM